MRTLRFDYDDDLLNVVDSINKVLREAFGVEFVDDGEVHDGFMIYHLKPVMRPWKNTAD